MPKRMFWPIAMLVIGAILIATRLELLPADFLNLWPIVLIVVGLGGVLISDKEEWDVDSKPASKKSAKRKSAPKTKKTTKRKK
jgi:hypothetical protein